MSKHMINKLIRAIEMSDANLQLYLEDPPGFVASWLEGAAGTDRPSDDRSLTGPERAAFDTRDYAALYSLGAHPYLLWHWVEATYLHEVTWPEMVERFRRDVAPLPVPDTIL